MSATHSPNAEAPRGRLPLLRRLAPRTFQARLTLGFVGVVALTLALVSIFVVNRLDDYFTRQQQTDLTHRANVVASYVDGIAAEVEQATGRPVIGADGMVNPAVLALLETQATTLADLLAQADVDIVLGVFAEGVGFVPATNGTFHAELQGDPVAGQSRENLRADPYWHQSTRSRFPYVIEVTLSNPYTFRQTAIANVTSLLAAVGVVALGLAIVVAAGTALRFTTPLRRLTEASRSLAEGDLSKRIELTDARAGSSELSELAIQFNAMADRLEESVAIIRHDRDRSRDFLADVSHELRTPIAALLTFNELLTAQAGQDPAARTEFLEASRVQLERLDWLAQNLLELSKLDSGLVLLDLRPDDVRAAVESAVEQAMPAANRRGVSLSLTLPDAPLRIRHDPQRVGQVVTNLVANAIKFTPPGGSITVAVTPHRDGARIEVNDTGVGIDASELPRIFDRFYRGSRANEARSSGSGLGLAIVRSIVDMHRGTVTVESSLGTGSRFAVFLPRDPRVEEGPDATDPGAVAGPAVHEPGGDVGTADRPEDVTHMGPAGSLDASGPKMVDSSPTGAPSLNRESSG
ncbi:MAG TPA: HAMP domain-containing sensor histidine kinase [Candidatus Limnocylindrales bacterium]|nr:HAMP domain-containing sensor histidine kinase [Candidatus Limnocylindrales bacterium]